VINRIKKAINPQKIMKHQFLFSHLQRIIPLIILLFFFFMDQLFADVMVPPFVPGNVSISSELLLSLEKPFLNHFSSSIWGGAGLITNFPLENRQKNISPGIEGALELRFYPVDSEIKKTFLSFYLGIGYMLAQEVDAAYWKRVITWGGKLGYKFVPWSLNWGSRKIRMDIEPYISIAWTTYWERYWANLGFRFVGEFPLH